MPREVQRLVAPGGHHRSIQHDPELQALSAHVAAAAAAEFATATTVQVLGGMGFTHEHDAHLYVKRAILLAQTLGGASTQLSRLLDLPEAL